jgi:hypothetical protein
LHWPTDVRREAQPHSAIVRGDALMQNLRRGHDELDAGDYPSARRGELWGGITMRSLLFQSCESRFQSCNIAASRM